MSLWSIIPSLNFSFVSNSGLHLNFLLHGVKDPLSTGIGLSPYLWRFVPSCNIFLGDYQETKEHNLDPPKWAMTLLFRVWLVLVWICANPSGLLGNARCHFGDLVEANPVTEQVSIGPICLSYFSSSNFPETQCLSSEL